MEKIFVVGDVHGEAKMLKKILKYWNQTDEQLILLGDLADRGSYSKEALELAYHLKMNKNAIVLKGNHDDMLAKFLKNPEMHFLLYYINGGEKTLDSLLGNQLEIKEPGKNAAKIKAIYPWLLPFLESLPYFYEWEDYFFVHAGVNLTLKDWRNSTETDYIWIREGFYDQKNTTGKRIVFGHTVTPNLHQDVNNFDIWQSGDGLIGIDGGAVYGGKLHALRLSKEGIEKKFTVSKEDLTDV